MQINTLYNENCLVTMKRMDDNSIDSIVTDPPYGIRFMNKKWDYDIPSVDIWKECLRVLKPCGHLLSFAGTRTQHRMVTNIEDAGFEIRDMIAYVYASGFPKSLNISKAIDKQLGAKRKVVGVAGKSGSKRNCMMSDFKGGTYMTTLPSTDEAIQFEKFGTALKPSLEPITLARKPLSEQTIASNVLKWGTGGINIDGCRVPYTKDNPPIPQLAQNKINVDSKKTMYDGQSFNKSVTKAIIGGSLDGRFPANLIHDGSDEVKNMFPDTKSGKVINDKTAYNNSKSNTSFIKGETNQFNQYGDNGNASRFFYCAKPSKKERGKNNTHPTVKPIALMKYLVTLVTPPNGIVYDPFMGSGSTLIACKLLDFDYIGSELDKSSCDIANERLISNEDIIKKEKEDKINNLFNF